MWIELSECNLKLLILLIFPIFKRVQDFTKKLYIKEEIYKDKTLFKTFRYYFSYTLSFIPLIILYFRTKKGKKDLLAQKEEKDHNIESKVTYTQIDSFMMTNTITELKTVNTRKKRIKSYLFLGGLCLMALFCYYYRYFLEKFTDRDFKQSMGIFFDMAGYILFSYLILKQKLYLHSYVSMGIIALLLIVLFIITTTYFGDNKMMILQSFGYYFFYSAFFVLYDILKKKYMVMFFNTPYFMMLVIGIFGSIFVLIYDLISFGVNKDKEKVEVADGFKTNIDGAGPAFALILDIIVQFIWNLGIWMTIYYFTPCHHFMSQYISEFIYYVKSARESKNKPFYATHNIIIFSIFAAIIFCCCLIFNEVVILNFCNLDYNTKKRIRERQRYESKKTTSAQILLENDEENIEMREQQSSDLSSNQ